MSAGSPIEVESVSSEARTARLLIAQFAQSLEPFINGAAVDRQSLPLEKRDSHGNMVEELAPDVVYQKVAPRSEAEGTGAGRGGVFALDNPGECNPILDRVLANSAEAIPWSISPECILDPVNDLDTPMAQLQEIAGSQTEVARLVSEPGLLAGPAAAREAMGDSASYPNSSIGLDAVAGLSQVGDSPPAESLAISEMLERIWEEGNSLTDPAPLFPPADVSPNQMQHPAIGRGGGDSWDPGGMSPARTAGCWGAAGMGEGLWQSGTIGPQPESEAGLNSMARESIDELASRLLATTERLEAATQQLLSAAPRSLASPPRQFRGRVDG
jgi:hypothetical protein